MATNLWTVLPNRPVATQIISAGDGPTLITNTDLNNTVFLGDTDSIKATDPQGINPLGPNGSVSVDGKNDLFVVNGNATPVVVATLTGGLSNFLGITQGGGALAIPAIRSPNFGPTTGWEILQNGSAIFRSITLPAGSGGATVFAQSTTPTANNVNDLWINTGNNNEILTWNGSSWVAQQLGTSAISNGAITTALLAAGIVYAGIINGTTVSAATINGSTFNGTDFIFNSSGLFFYSGTPALGNLVLTIGTTSAGTDGFGNAYAAGNIVVYNSSTAFTVIKASSAGNLLLGAGSSAGAGLELPAQSATPTSSTSILYADSSGNISYRNGSGGFNGHLVNSLNTDITVRTVTSTTATQISGLFTIPANDMQVGAIYRFKCEGGGTQGSTAQAFGLLAALNGTGIASSGFSGNQIAISTAFTWWVECKLIIITTGVSGTCKMIITGGVSTSGRPTQTQAGPFGAFSTTAQSIDTTSSNTVSVLANVGSTTGAPTINGIYSTLERIGS